MKSETLSGDLAAHLRARIPLGERRRCSLETGVPNPTLTRKLKGVGSFNLDEVERIAKWLGTDVPTLLEAAATGAPQ